MNETESGDSQTEQSDKSKKAKKQRRLERKERSLLKQKKRLSIKLTEQAQKVCIFYEKIMNFFSKLGDRGKQPFDGKGLSRL